MSGERQANLNLSLTLVEVKLVQFLSACEPEKERLLRNKKIYYRFLENILNHLTADITEEAEYCSMLADVMLG